MRESPHRLIRARTDPLSARTGQCPVQLTRRRTVVGVARLRKHRTIQPPSWPSKPGRARILIENPDGAQLWAHAGVLQEAGYETATCFGPSPEERIACPLISNGSCPLIETADVVISTTRLADGGEVLAALHRCCSERLIVEDADPRALPMEEKRLLAAVATALGQQSTASPHGHPARLV